MLRLIASRISRSACEIPSVCSTSAPDLTFSLAAALSWGLSREVSSLCSASVQLGSAARPPPCRGSLLSSSPSPLLSALRDATSVLHAHVPPPWAPPPCSPLAAGPRAHLLPCEWMAVRTVFGAPARKVNKQIHTHDKYKVVNPQPTYE